MNNIILARFMHSVHFIKYGGDRKHHLWLQYWNGNRKINIQYDYMIISELERMKNYE